MSSPNCTSKSATVCHALSTRTVSIHPSCEIDSKSEPCGIVVRVRSREGRRNRAPPPRVRWKDGKKVNPAVAAAEDAKVAAAAAGGKA